MKKSLLTMAVASTLAITACGPEKQAEEAAAVEAPAEVAVRFDTNEQKLSYGLGQDIARQFKTAGMPVEADAFFAGFKDQLADAEPQVAEADIRAAAQVIQEQVMADKQKERDELAAKNKMEGEQFLAENAKKEGVIVTESGLQYTVQEQGEGLKPSKTDRVTVHYAGTLLDGTEFDSSHKRGQPATFSLGQVIAGWTEGVQLMSPGAKYTFYVPSDLAYGPGGTRGLIGPNATLIFEVELIGIEGAPQETPAEAKARMEAEEAAAAIKAAEEAAAAENTAEAPTE